ARHQPRRGRDGGRHRAGGSGVLAARAAVPRASSPLDAAVKESPAMAIEPRTDAAMRLARDGGTPARTRPEHPMFPGGMEVGDEELAALERVVRSRNLFRYYGVGVGPDEVAAFEREFAEHVGARHALCVNAGSSALICGLIGAGVGPGDEVIVPAYTWNATPNAVI